MTTRVAHNVLLSNKGNTCLPYCLLSHELVESILVCMMHACKMPKMMMNYLL